MKDSKLHPAFETLFKTTFPGLIRDKKHLNQEIKGQTIEDKLGYIPDKDLPYEAIETEEELCFVPDEELPYIPIETEWEKNFIPDENLPYFDL